MNKTAASLIDPAIEMHFLSIIRSLKSESSFEYSVQLEVRSIIKLLRGFESLLVKFGLYEERHPLAFALSDLNLHMRILSEYLKGIPVEKIEVVEMVDFCQAQLRQLLEIAGEVMLEERQPAAANYVS